MIKAVVFDIGGVLEIVDDVSWPENWMRRWHERGANSGETFSAAEPISEPVTESEVRAIYARRFGLDDTQADEMMADLWDAYCGELDVEMRDFVAGLRPRYRTALLSNSGDGARREEQRRYGFDDLVDTIVYSHEVGVAKPDPAIYELTARRVGVEADEIVFIDDHEPNVVAAQELGWYGVHHVNAAESIRQITDILNRTADS